MEESCELHSEDDKALSEKNKKRTVKTRSQVEALEKFYDEHKYPTESMKLELGKKLGLTEKQVSSWFCHRRLKDKKLLLGESYANGRHDRSSGVIQDVGSGSGLRQDSCGSTKQGDEKIYDAREVESRRLAGQELPNADQTYEHGSRYIGNFSRMDDTSSGSNSSLRNKYFKVDPVDMATSRYATQNFSINMKGGNARSGPSGYLKVKGNIGNAAITAVKRQLGRHYREDGPPLGIEFDPLPPGAFESSVRVPVTESYYAGDQVQQCSPDVPKIHQEHLSKLYHVEENKPTHLVDASKIRRQPISGTGYGYISKRGSQNAGLDGKKYKIMPGSDHCEKFPQKFSSSKHRLLDVHEGLAREMATHESSGKYESGAASFVGGFKTDSARHHKLQSYGGECNPERARPRLQHYNNKVPMVAPGSGLHSNPSDLTSKGWKYNAVEDEGRARKVAKVEKIYGERRIVDDDRDEVQVNIPPKNEMRRVKVEIADQGYAAKASREDHMIKRPVTEMPSSFSEDGDDDDDDDEETADTSS